MPNHLQTLLHSHISLQNRTCSRFCGSRITCCKDVSTKALDVMYFCVEFELEIESFTVCDPFGNKISLWQSSVGGNGLPPRQVPLSGYNAILEPHRPVAIYTDRPTRSFLANKKKKNQLSWTILLVLSWGQFHNLSDTSVFNMAQQLLIEINRALGLNWW
jgi:hypothetical protein